MCGDDDIMDSETYKALSICLGNGGPQPDRRMEKVVIEPIRRGDFHITAYISNSWLDFECRKPVALTTMEYVDWSGPERPLYKAKAKAKTEAEAEAEAEKGGTYLTEDSDQALIYMRGFLRWDGCMEIYREVFHYGGAGDIEDEYRCIRRVRRLAEGRMGHWEGDIPKDLY